MQPRPISLDHLGLYRDGGSISASFTGDDGNTYCLRFQISRPRDPEQPPKWGAAVLETHTLSDYTSPITGVTSPDWKQSSKSISWAKARAILDALEPFMNGFESDYLWVFEAMKRSAEENLASRA